MMQIALYEPDIPQNTGTILRLGACLGVPVHIVGPAAFDSSERNFRRAGLDYLDQVELVNHASFATFDAWRRQQGRRLVLLSTKGDTAHVDFAFHAGDVLLCGRESAGVPEAVHAAADARLCVPMRPGLRSLNVAVALAIVLGEALRQTGGFPR
jgi:tRNA (cytidine/uridine-2'-O-)-methyltransferase